MLAIRIVLGPFVLLDLEALYRRPVEEGDPEEEPDDEGPREVLPFGFVLAELADPAPDPVFRDLDP